MDCDAAAAAAAVELDGETPMLEDIETPETELNWKDLTQLLKQKLTSEAFDKTLRYVPVYSHLR